MRKQGSLDGIILLVISFSVINYVVSRVDGVDLGLPTFCARAAMAQRTVRILVRKRFIDTIVL